jgi:hypothetical protein
MGYLLEVRADGVFRAASKLRAAMRENCGVITGFVCASVFRAGREPPLACYVSGHDFSRWLMNAVRAVVRLSLATGCIGLISLAACTDDEPGLGGGGGLGDTAGPSVPGSDGGAFLPGTGSTTGGGSIPSGPGSITGGVSTGTAGGGGNSSPASAGGGNDNQWCQVKAALDKHCTTCHDGKGSFGSPMGLTTYADLTKDSTIVAGKKIYERVGARMHDTMRPMPPQGEVPAADKALIDAWIAARAPGSASDMCAPAPVAPTGGGGVSADYPADCEQKFEFRANGGGNAPFQVRPGGQFYQDFMFSAPWSGDVQAVTMKPLVDNKKVLHHYILYQASGAFLVGWSPGKNETLLPPDVGVFLPGSGQLKMTVHYYNANAGAKMEQDRSGVEICITKKKRPKTAAVMPFAANPVVPANTPSAEASSTCTVSSSEPVHIITSSPHAHQLGIHAKFTIQRANGQTEVIHDKPFNFEEQTTWPVDFVVNNGDRVTTTCIYRNMTNRAVSFGTNTQDEMCFNFALYYPMCAMTCLQEDTLAAAWSLTQGGGCPTGGAIGGLLGGGGGTGAGGFIGGLLSP